MIISLAMDDRFADNGPNIVPKECKINPEPDSDAGQIPTSEQMMNERVDTVFKPSTFKDIFPPIVIPKPSRIKGIGEDWFRRELQNGLNRSKSNLNYHGPIKLSLENEPNGNFQNQSET